MFVLKGRVYLVAFDKLFFGSFHDTHVSLEQQVLLLQMLDRGCVRFPTHISQKCETLIPVYDSICIWQDGFKLRDYLKAEVTFDF